MLLVSLPDVKLAGICVKIVWVTIGSVLNKVFKTYGRGCNRMWAKAADNSVRSWNRGSNVAPSKLTLTFQCLVMLLVMFLSVCKILRVVLTYLQLIVMMQC